MRIKPLNRISNGPDALTHIYSQIPPREDGMVLIAFPVGKGQFDLAVN